MDNLEWNISYKDYLDMMNSSAYANLHKYYMQETYWDALGVARQELPHSNFLRWLLRGGNGSELGDYPIRKLLETACLAKDALYKTNNQSWYVSKTGDTRNIFVQNEIYYEEIKFGRYLVRDIQVRNELVIKGQRRADVFIVLRVRFQCDFDDKYIVILIENKVSSAENDRQTKDYAEALSSLKTVRSLIDEVYQTSADALDVLVADIYLNAYTVRDIAKNLDLWMVEEDKNKGNILPVSRQFITICYQQLLDNMLIPITKIAPEGVSKERLNDYIRCLGQARPEAAKPEKYLVMAISNEEKKYARRLWEYKPNRSILKDIYFSMDENNFFLISEEERRFYIALANVFELIFAENPDEEQNDLLNAIKKSRKSTRANRVIYYIHNGVETEYKSYANMSIGRLCRDVIEDFVLTQGWEREKVDAFRKRLWKLHLNWQREFILFSDEIEYLEKTDTDIYKSNSYAKPKREGCYRTKYLAEFYHSFFTKYSKEKDFDVLLKVDPSQIEDSDNQIILSDGTVAYVARYWGIDDFDTLVKILEKEYKYKVNYRV